jgi:hypothetical protein
LVTRENSTLLGFYRALGWDSMDLHLMGKELA